MQVARNSLYACFILLAYQTPVYNALQLSQSLHISSKAVEAQVHLCYHLQADRVGRVVDNGCVKTVTSLVQYCASQLKELSLLSDDPAPAVTRILFTQNDVMARRSGRRHGCAICTATLRA